MQTLKLTDRDIEKASAGKTKHILVVGASRGIGEAVARALAEDGHRMSLCARSYNRLLGVAMDIGNDRALAQRMDLADITSIDNGVVAAETRFGPIDTLICTAAAWAPTPADDLSPEARGAFRRVVEVNVIGTWYLLQLVSSRMAKGGRIVVLGGSAARTPAPASHAYTASKHALMGMVRGLAVDLAAKNIRINAINPGPVDTPLLQEQLRKRSEQTGQPIAQVSASVVAGQPLRRLLKPSEVVGYVRFLLGPSGDGITGQGIDLSGGGVLA